MHGPEFGSAVVALCAGGRGEMVTTLEDVDSAAIAQEGLLQQDAGNLEKAEELFLAALLLAERTHGKQAVEVGVCQQNLSRLYRKMVLPRLRA